MRSKPKGAKYRNLTARSGVIYYQRRVSGRRIRFSCETNDWEEAVAVARLYEERKGTALHLRLRPRLDRLGQTSVPV